MQIYILIDQNSGFVWGTAKAETPVEACRAVDADIGGMVTRTYDDIGAQRFDGREGYAVHIVPDADAQRAATLNGQDAEEIEWAASLPLAANVATTTQWD